MFDAKEYRRRYYASHKEAAYKAYREWIAVHPEKRREYDQRYSRTCTLSHPEKNREKNRRWRLAHPEANRERLRQWDKLHPESARLRGPRRRAHLASVVATLTHSDWLELCWQHQMACVYCGVFGPLTIDHIIPISKGGPHIKENIVPACRSCNSRKGNKPEAQFKRANPKGKERKVN